MILDKHAFDILQEIVKQFDENPQDERYYHPVPLGRSREYRLYKVFLWSPLEQFEISLSCPEHGLKLKSSTWTSDVLRANSNRHPRFIFGLFSNVLLIQRFYVCPAKPKHAYLSNSQIIMDMLSNEVKELFPYKRYHRSMFSFQVVDYIFQQITSGNTFLQITEGMANYHFMEFQRENPLADLSAFYDNMMYSFPSIDKIQHVFLDVYQERKQYYQDAVMDCVPLVCIIVDRRFSVGNKAPTQLPNTTRKSLLEKRKVFILADESRRVIGWKLTKSLEHEEIEETLVGVRDKMYDVSSFKYIITENCCEEREFFQSIFGPVDVKMDVYQGLNRIADCFPKDLSQTKQVSEELFSIVRLNGDDSAEKVTADPPTILANLDKYFNRHANFFQSLPNENRNEFLNEIQKLREHIMQGCLSGIESNHNSEANDPLHKFLDRNCVAGSSVMSPELIMAILSILFYTHNKKLNGTNHKCNGKIVPTQPVQDILCRSSSHFLLNDDGESMLELQHINEIGDLTAESIINAILTKIKNVHATLLCLKASCSKPSFPIENLLRIKHEEWNKGDSMPDESVVLTHQEILKWNCLTFGFSLEDIPKDGDCLFRSILRQMKVEYEELDEEHVWRNFIKSKDITFANEEQDILTLRKLFVEEIQSNGKYVTFAVNGEDLTSFLNPGVFASNSGDFVVDACSNILALPIVVVTSAKDMSVVTFFPSSQIYPEPIYLAYNCLESHYNVPIKMTTEESMDTSQTDGEMRSCTCSSEPGKTCCNPNSKYNNRCPCLKLGQPCNHKCRCMECGNEKTFETLSPDFGCRCGHNNTSPACCDVDGRRRTKCKCYRSKNGCSANCVCKSCANTYGARVATVVDHKVRKASISKRKAYTKEKSSVFLTKEDSQHLQGSWTFTETVTLYVCFDVVNQTDVSPSVPNVHSLYMVVYKHVKSLNADAELKLRPKTESQVHSKLQLMST